MKTNFNLKILISIFIGLIIFNPLITFSQEPNLSPEETFKQYREEAEGGASWAQYNTALCYLYGYGTQKDEKKALEYLIKSADQKYVNAYLILGGLYVSDAYDFKNEMTGFKYLKLAVENGVPGSKIYLAHAYQYGEGVAIDLNKAFNLYHEEAEEGNTLAMVMVADFYEKGEGVQQNYPEALRWIKQSSQLNGLNAKIQLGRYYKDGIGTSKDYAKAIQCLQEAIEEATEQTWIWLAYKTLADIYNSFGPIQNLDLANQYIDKSIQIFTNDGKGPNSGNTGLMEDWINKYLMDIYNTKGTILLNLGKDEEALKLAENIVSINPNYESNDDSSLMDFYKKSSKNEPIYQAKCTLNSDVDIDIPLNSGKINENTFAVIIGNENYDDLQNVNYALNDAEIFAQYCKSVLNLPEHNIRLYKNATYGKMISAIEDIKMIAEAYSGDLSIILYYAGHGLPGENDRVSYLLPTDNNGKNIALSVSLTDLMETLKNITTKHSLVFLDACFSGANRGDGMLASARGVALKPKPISKEEKVILFSATTEDETAYPYDEKQHGLFTYFLLKKLKETEGKVKMKDLAEYVTSNVKKHSVVVNYKSQTPVVSTLSDLEFDIIDF